MKDRVALGWAAVTLVLHLAVAGRYGFFRDELYFIVCGQHPSFGYVDQPPLVPLLAAGAYALGHQLWIVRLVPALAAAGVVLASIAFARLFGATNGAAHLTGVTVALGPMFLGLDATFNTTVFDPVAWTLVGLLFARAYLKDDSRALVWAGVVAGVALEAKYYAVVWLAALTSGALATPMRSLLRRRELYAGAAIALLLAAPSIVWQAVHGWPFVELVHAAGHKNAVVTPLGFVSEQILVMNPIAAPVWIAGILAPFLRRDMREARAFSIAFVVTILLTMAGGGKDYYVAAAYPIVFALGAIALDRMLLPALRIGYTAVIVALAALIAPLPLPIFPPAAAHSYLAALHLAPAPSERLAIGLLPQHFADQFGWPKLAATVAAVYDGLPPAERSKAYVMTNNYGEAAAIDIFDAGRGLPPTLSGHNQYHLWGPHGYDGSVLIDVGATVKDDLPYCRSATLAATFTAPYVMPYEDHLGIVLCRGLREPVAKMWQESKHYI
jgi:4-amino-4-deoxy-L-arabinose transferase-like glycosyltransferase